MSQDSDINDLISILRPADTNPARLLQGVVTDIDPTYETCSVALQGGGGGSTGGIRWLRDAYFPVILDAVFLLRNGPDLFIIGKTLGAPSTFSPMIHLVSATSVNMVVNDAQYSFTMDDAGATLHPEFTKFGVYLYPRRPGWWAITPRAAFSADSTGYRGVYIKVNSTTTIEIHTQPGHAGAVNHLSPTLIYPFSGDDYFWPELRHNSGNPSMNGHLKDLTVQWIRPL